MSLKQDREPWERQEDESQVAFEAFCVYRDLGHEPEGQPKVKRTYANVARKLGKSQQIVARWGLRWDWDHRSREYDNELQRMELKARKDEIKKMQKMHVQYGLALQKKALQALSRLAEEDMSTRNVLDYLIQGIEIEKRARTEGVVDSMQQGSKGGGTLNLLDDEPPSGMMQLVNSLREAKKGNDG